MVYGVQVPCTTWPCRGGRRGSIRTKLINPKLKASENACLQAVVWVCVCARDWELVIREGAKGSQICCVNLGRYPGTCFAVDWQNSKIDILGPATFIAFLVFWDSRLLPREPDDSDESLVQYSAPDFQRIHPAGNGTQASTWDREHGRRAKTWKPRSDATAG